MAFKGCPRRAQYGRQKGRPNRHRSRETASQLGNTATLRLMICYGARLVRNNNIRREKKGLYSLGCCDTQRTAQEETGNRKEGVRKSFPLSPGTQKGEGRGCLGAEPSIKESMWITQCVEFLQPLSARPQSMHAQVSGRRDDDEQAESRACQPSV